MREYLFGGNGCLISFNVTNSFPSAVASQIAVGGNPQLTGPSGIIVDNEANTTTFPQAASIYFNALHQNAACNNNTVTTDTGGCAVKLTQAGLN